MAEHPKTVANALIKALSIMGRIGDTDIAMTGHPTDDGHNTKSEFMLLLVDGLHWTISVSPVASSAKPAKYEAVAIAARRAAESMDNFHAAQKINLDDYNKIDN